MIVYKSIYLGIGIRSIEIRAQVIKNYTYSTKRALLNVQLMSTEAYTYTLSLLTHLLTH